MSNLCRHNTWECVEPCHIRTSIVNLQGNGFHTTSKQPSGQKTYWYFLVLSLVSNHLQFCQIQMTKTRSVFRFRIGKQLFWWPECKTQQLCIMFDCCLDCGWLDKVADTAAQLQWDCCTLIADGNAQNFYYHNMWDVELLCCCCNMFRVSIAERQSRQHQLLGSDKRSDPNLGFGRFSSLSGTCWSTAASSVLLWCLKSSPLERWRREREAEARSSRRGEECIRPLAAADCWRPERHQPHHQQEEEEAGRKEKELEQLVMTSVWGASNPAAHM